MVSCQIYLSEEEEVIITKVAEKYDIPKYEAIKKIIREYKIDG